MLLPFKFDFKNPNYIEVINWRIERLNDLRKTPEIIPNLKNYYKDNIAQYINDWGTTYDPRNVDCGLPALVPFILFPRQIEFVDWVMARWKSREPGIADKSRDMGMSWLTVGIACSLCTLFDGISIGFGSRKEEYVDRIGNPKSLLYKGRKYISLLPAEFRGEWDEKKHSSHMRIQFPQTNATITGEAGDNLGRGDRKSIEFVDESAHLARPELIEASLSETTNCRIDVSTPRGMSNPFARKRFSGKVSVFSMHWTDDPRKDEAWYKKKCDEIDDAVVIAQELDLDYSASVEGVIIPALWVKAAIDSHIKLNIKPSGERIASFDVADSGLDNNCFCGKYGILLEYLESWSGRGKDIFDSVQKVFTLSDVFNYYRIRYDADGVGAGVKGDARIINGMREEKHNKIDKRNKYKKLPFDMFRGSGEIVNPLGNPFKQHGEMEDREKGRTNEDLFANYKAQSWWALRKRFQTTYRAVISGLLVDQNDIISISSSCPELRELVIELSQPTFTYSDLGKILVNKAPENSRSPNRADATMMAYAPIPVKQRSFFDV